MLKKFERPKDLKDLTLEIEKDSLVVNGLPHPYSSMGHVEDLPLMRKHSEIVCRNGGKILEIGFGLGYSSDFIQSHTIISHTIVEIHPQIIERLHDWSLNKSNVIVIEGDWFDKIDEICVTEYDGIFLDTHLDKNLFEFRKKVVDKCLRNGGIFTWKCPSFPLFDGATLDFDYSDVKIEFVNSRPWKCPYIISNHQLK